MHFKHMFFSTFLDFFLEIFHSFGRREGGGSDPSVEFSTLFFMGSLNHLFFLRFMVYKLFFLRLMMASKETSIKQLLWVVSNTQLPNKCHRMSVHCCIFHLSTYLLQHYNKSHPFLDARKPHLPTGG